MYKSILANNRSITSAKVLIIDDSEVSRKITEKFLSDEGFENISFALDGSDGLNSLKKDKPQLVVCDLFMPNMDGYEFCRKVRANKNLSNIPIIVQTSATDPKDINKAFISGANDATQKPLQREEFLSKVSLHLENALYKNRVESELESAKVMQESIMPNEDDIAKIKKQYNLDLCAHFAPSSEVGGDFWGAKQVSHTELAVFNVDLSGHGVAAALNTFRVSSLIEDKNNIFSSPSVFLKKINKRMKEFMPLGQFATMFYGVINTETNTLKFSGAGCPNPFIINADGNTSILDTKGIPLGVLEETEYTDSEIKFQKGDLLCLFSDALIETPNDHDEMFDHNKLQKILSKNAGMSAKKTLNELLKRFNSFIGDNEISDDLTINLYKRK